ncbi:MFS transporter, partial [Candidatus Woesearchaeota archaeon]|nr:MFS transporter [Candidatus Woesearchaeota archaeon]
MKSFWHYTLLSSIYAAAASMILPVLGPYLTSLGYDEATTSILFALFPLFTIITVPLIGAAADRFGKHLVI